MVFELQRWSDAHWLGFAMMQRDPDVMADLGGPFDENASREKFECYSDAWKANGISRWAVVDSSNQFLGYAGVMLRADAEHPLGAHYEIGWRFCRNAWGRGLATESARQALGHAWSTLNIAEVVSYTAVDNIRSQKVMQRLGLRRDPDRDFTARYPKGDWSGLTWVADNPTIARQ